jgi:enoyl-CoA hydratase
MTNEILYTEQAGIGVIQFNRPQARNALNWSAQEQFAAVVEDVYQNGGPRALIITGKGDKAFTSGGDLKELAGVEGKESGERLSTTMGAALEKLTQLLLPVIGAVNGDAIGGGCEIVTACDFRIAASHVQFRFAQIQVALTTGWGGTARLIHLINLSRAIELLLTGRSFSAREAYKIGFIHRIADEKTPVLDDAKEWAYELMELPGGALAAAKQLAWESVDLPLDRAYQREREQFTELWQEQDHLEAMAAFNQKRAPKFKKDS